MLQLRALARDPLIAGFVADLPAAILELGVQGVNLTIDRYWLRAVQATIPARVPLAVAVGGAEGESGIGMRAARMLAPWIYDFDQRPPNWNDYCKAHGYPPNAHPVAVEVLFLADEEHALFSDAPNHLEAHPVLYQRRARAVGYGSSTLSGGSRIRGVGPGTLGGFVWDTTQQRTYGVSCWHVLGDRGTAVLTAPRFPWERPASIGVVVGATLPTRSQADSRCNRVATAGVPLDLALFELEPQLVPDRLFARLGAIDHLTPIGDMTSEDPVAFIGASSGYSEARAYDLNIYRTVMIDGAEYCMGDMFTLRARERRYVNAAISKGGDSGAWVLSNAGGTLAWDGMIVAGDDVETYCCFAENIWSDITSHYPNLSFNR